MFKSIPKQGVIYLILAKIHTLYLYLIFLPCERITGFWKERRVFRKRHGYKPDVARPRSFSEKILHRKLRNRSPLLTRTADKYAVRAYVREKLGDSLADDVLIPLLHVTKQPRAIPFDKLPNRYIIKVNHACGRNLIVTKSTKLSRRTIVRQCRNWLLIQYGLEKHQWAYRHVPRKIVIEELLVDSNGRIPRDYKFFVFHGRCHYIQLDVDRDTHGAHRRNLYDREWNPIAVTIKYAPDGEVPKPTSLDRMLEIAENLGRDFDFVRVDLYAVDDRVFFGELTHYPGAGRVPIYPTAADFEFGSHWHLQL